MGKDLISLRAVRRYFEENFDDQKTLRLAAGIIEHPRLKALDLDKDENLKSIFKMPDVRRDLPLRPILRYLAIISGRKAHPLQLTEKDFSKTCALAEDLAERTPETVLALAREKVFAKPEPKEGLYRGDIPSAVKINTSVREQFVELSKNKIGSEDRLLEEMQKIFSRAVKFVPSAGAKAHKLLPHLALPVDCYDDAETGMRFVVAGGHQKALFSVERILPLRTLKWRAKATGARRVMAVLRDDAIRWNNFRI